MANATEVCHGGPIGLRDDFDAPALRRLARASRDPDQLRRVLSLAEIHDGRSRGNAVRAGGASPRTVRDRAVRVKAGCPEGLTDPGHPSVRHGRRVQWSEAYRSAITLPIGYRTGLISAASKPGLRLEAGTSTAGCLPDYPPDGTIVGDKPPLGGISANWYSTTMVGRSSGIPT